MIEMGSIMINEYLRSFEVKWKGINSLFLLEIDHRSELLIGFGSIG